MNQQRNNETASGPVSDLTGLLGTECQYTIEIPSGLHPDTGDLVARFSVALAEKLHKAEQKYGYDNGWKEDDNWGEECMGKLLEHIEKGDPIDVAAYCAFMWHHGWKTSIRSVIMP